MFANKWGYQRCHYKWLPCKVVWLPTVNTEKELPSFLLKRRNWACLIKNAVHNWMSGVSDVGLMASKDSHGSSGTDQAAPGPAFLPANPGPPGFHPSDSAILLHSSPVSGYHGSCTILTPPSPKNSYNSLMLSPPVCSWNVVLLSLLLLIHPQNLRGWGRWR